MYGCLSCGPHRGPGLQPRHVPWVGIKLATLWFTAHAQSTEPHHPGLPLIFKEALIFKERGRVGKGGREGGKEGEGVCERERDRDTQTDRQKHGCDRETGTSHLLYPTWRRTDLQPTHVPWAGMNPATLWFMQWHSNQLSHEARVHFCTFNTHLSVISLHTWHFAFCNQPYVFKLYFGKVTSANVTVMIIFQYIKSKCCTP